jgi:hypothetical protein
MRYYVKLSLQLAKSLKWTVVEAPMVWILCSALPAAGPKECEMMRRTNWLQDSAKDFTQFPEMYFNIEHAFLHS